MKTDKAQIMQFKGGLWFIVILIMAILSILSSVGSTTFAQDPNPQVNLTPISTIESTPEFVPPQLSTDALQAMSASIATRIPVGTSPNGISLNPNTRKGYVINSTSSNVSILDISSNKRTRNIWAGQKLYWGIALKLGTDRLYVSDNARGQVLEIQEETGSVIDTISLGNVYPEGIAINTNLNKAYVAHSGYLLSVINLSTNQVAKVVNTGCCNHMIAVNKVNNRVYVTRSYYNRVTVIDGNSDTYLQSVSVGSDPWGVAVNSKTNLIYVANSGSNTVSVINGATNAVIKTIAVQTRPWGIAVNEDANHVYVANSWSNSVSIIDGNTNQVVETVPNVGSRPVGIDANPKTGKVYVTNEVGNDVTVIVDSAAVPPPSTLTPIILVPGYYASYNKYRMYPANNYEDKWEWWPGIFGYSAEDVYKDLIDALEDVGYDSDPNSPNQNLFIAYYNWLRPNAESAVNDLAPIITKALTKTGATTVHIITHSNGGLVTRSLIQNEPQSTVIDELIMLAPPNYGVARVYPAWAGGDIHRESWKIQIFVYSSLMNAYEIGTTCREGIPIPDCIRYKFIKYQNFIHTYISSAKDLIPVYDFLMNSNGQFKSYQDDMHLENRNLALDAMNQDVQNGLINKVGNITIIGGLTHSTYDAYVYEDCSDCTPLWKDGKLSQDIKDDGDGTVQRHRVLLPDITSIMIEADHTEIVSEAIPQIFDILQLPEPTPGPPPPTPPLPPFPSDTLVYNVVRNINTTDSNGNTASMSKVEASDIPYSVPVHLLITDPLGRKLGYQTNGTFINQIPYAFYHGEIDEPKIIAIPNPIEGNYHTQVIGNNSGTFGIVAATSKLDRVLSVITGTTSAGQVSTYDINYVAPIDTYLPMIFKN